MNTEEKKPEKWPAWTPVTERFPPADGCLRLLFTDGGIFTHLVLGERIRGEWWDDEEMIVQHVTHWMDLPDAPPIAEPQGGRKP